MDSRTAPPSNVLGMGAFLFFRSNPTLKEAHRMAKQHDGHYVHTRFSEDRMKEPENGDARLAEWLILEFFVRQGDSARHRYEMGFLRYVNKHPVEWECIRRELLEGVYTPPEEYRRMLKERVQTVCRLRKAWIAAKEQ